MAYPIPTHKHIDFPYGAHSHMYRDGHHKGVDFSVPVGTPVRAAVSGVVVHAGWNGKGPGRGWGSAFGLHIVVNQDKLPDGAAGLFGGYMHLSKLAVKPGDRVKAGQIIGWSGHSGNVTGPHLHFEIQRARFWAGWLGSVNPAKWLAA